MGEEPNLMAHLRQTVPYKFMDVLRKGRVVALPEALLAATSQARLEAYEAMARALHPECFLPPSSQPSPKERKAP